MGCGASQATKVEVFTDPIYIDINRSWNLAWKTVEAHKLGGMEKKLIVRRRGWKTIRVFVSSTFRDFHQEREVLVKKVFPDLRAWCESRRLYLVDVDLRWFPHLYSKLEAILDTCSYHSSSLSNDKTPHLDTLLTLVAVLTGQGVPKDFTSEGTLRACLGEIDRCYHENVMPFFINMTSERMGWVPVSSEVPEAVRSTYKWVEGLSVTEMEIMHGAYRKDNPNALFLLRDPAFLDEVPEAHKKEFIDSDKLAPYKLKILKKMICDRFPPNRVITYDVKYLGYHEDKKQVDLGGLDGTFSKSVYNFFKERIAMQYPLIDAETSPFLHTKEAHEAFLKSRCESVVGRDEILQKIDQYVMGSAGSDVPFLLVAGPGTGKSSVLAKAADMACIKATNGQIPRGGKQGWHVFYHFVGAVPGSTELLGILRRLLYEIKAVPEDRLPLNIDTAAQLICGVLNNPNTQPLVIVIDALNQLDEDTPSLLMNWVPRKLAPQIRCVFSMIDGTPQQLALSQREPQPYSVQLSPLTEENRRQIVTELLGRYNKRLDDEQMTSLLSKSSSENPLWLSIACEELRVFGRFREISDKINTLADGLLELESQILERFEEENGGELLIATLCLLEVSSRGLLEVELLSILGDEDNIMPPKSPSEENSADDEESVGKKDREQEKKKKSGDVGPLPAYKWTDIYRALRPFLRPFGDSGEGRLDFYHRSLSKAVRKRYFKASSGKSEDFIKRWWNSKLADFFECCPNLIRKIEEYPDQLIAINDRDRLESFLTQWPVFDELFNEEYSYKLLFFWRQGSSYVHCEQCYVNALNNLANSGASHAELGLRYSKIANFLHQVGRYTTSLELAEKAKQIEIDHLGARPEKLADIYQMSAVIMDEEMKQVEYMYASQIPKIKQIIEMFMSSIEIRRTLTGPENQRKLGNALNRLAFYYSGIGQRGGTVDMSPDNCREKALEVISESIEIFQSLNDEVKVADCTITKGVCYGNACPEQFREYSAAEEILMRVTGRLHISVDRLYLNSGIAYEESGNREKAYDYFYKWFELCKDLYGVHHVKTRRPISTLNEYAYRNIARHRGVEVPKLPAEINDE